VLLSIENNVSQEKQETIQCQHFPWQAIFCGGGFFILVLRVQDSIIRDHIMGGHTCDFHVIL